MLPVTGVMLQLTLASASLVAVTVTVCALAIGLGAVYRPFGSMLPVWGLMLQMYPAPPPVGENCVDPPAARLTVAGVTVIGAGLSWMVTESDLLGFRMLAAVIVTVCLLVIVAGAA